MIQYFFPLIILLLIDLVNIFFKKDNLNNNESIDNINCNYDVDDDIDVVITWVDSSDIFWRKQKNKFLYKKKLEKNREVISYGNNRYSPSGIEYLELYYCVSTIKKYMKWVRNIYIVTCFNQKPPFIKDFDNIIIVDHKDIIPEKYLPTFNNRVIECWLYKINGLSEKFIYFNDDMYVNQKINKNFFFKNDQPIITGYKYINYHLLLSFKFFINIFKYILPKNFITIQFANLNNSKLINSKYFIKISHVAIPLTKTLYKDTIKKYYNEWNITSKSKFRSSNDLRPTYFLANFSKYFSKYGNNRFLFGKNKILFYSSNKNINQINESVYLFGLTQIDYNMKNKIEKWFFDKHKIKPYKICF